MIEETINVKEDFKDSYTIYKCNTVYDQAIIKVEKRPTNVQAFINNISVPKSLDELKWYIYDYGCFHIDTIFESLDTEWTAPKWAKIGDIVFFMHAKYGFSSLTALRTQLNKNTHSYTSEEYKTMMDWIDYGLQLNKKYGGKIFAIAQVSGAPFYDNNLETSTENFHWSSKIYAPMDKITILDNPIDISEFNSFIFVSRQSAITPVLGNEFDKLKELIIKKNNIPEYLEESSATPFPLSKINKENWFKISNEYRRSFTLEAQFRSYYVNYLLQSISNRKTIYKECRCVKEGIANSFVDNVIYIEGKYLPVEVKLSINAQANICAQVNKYCNDNYIVIDSKYNKVIYSEHIYSNNCLVIDTDFIYMYSSLDDSLATIYNLDDLTSFEDLETIKSLIISSLHYN